MVGRSLVEALRAMGSEVAGCSRGRTGVPGIPHFAWDVVDQRVPAAMLQWGAEYVVHAAAATDVDHCEAHPEEAERVNVAGTAHVAHVARTSGARLVYLSTDSVFDGRRGLYRDDEPPNPINVYAATKARGEGEAMLCPRALVVRFNVIGPERLTSWILTSATRGDLIEVFDDVFFNPIETRDLADLIIELSVTGFEGVCHLASDEVVSKADYAERLVAHAGLMGRARLRRVRLADRCRQAPRPLNTSLRVSSRIEAQFAVPSLDAAIRRLAHGFPGLREPKQAGRAVRLSDGAPE
jgi:dTDP-4-dehydrorhamnose reductase